MTRKRRNSCAYAKSCLINVAILNAAFNSKGIFELRCKNISQDTTQVIIFITCRNTERQSKTWTYNYLMKSNEKHKKDISKKIHTKRWNTNYLGAFFLSSVFGKETFISAFISKLDAIYCLSKAHFSLACRIHGPWQAMRICLLPLASGANMWKLARGYGAQPTEEEAEGQRKESIPNR